MIKECNVILHNDKVAVILYDGNKIQVPHNDLIGDHAYIKFEDDKYAVTSKEEFDKQNLNTKVKIKKNSNNENKDLISVIDNEERGYDGL